MLHDKIDKLFKCINEASYIRYASTDAQERAIAGMQRSLKRIGKQVVGATTIGKHPQTVILDLTYQGSDIYIDDDGTTKIYGILVNPNNAAAVEHVLDGKWNPKTKEDTSKEQEFAEEQQDTGFDK